MSSSMAHASRIPRPISKGSVLKRTPSAPSKLEALRAQYQERRYQEQEQQLGANFNGNASPVTPDYMVESNNTKRGFLRDFFHERRNPNSADTQYRYKKPIYDNNKVIGYTNHPVVPYHKNSAGRDKSNPLAPIQHVSKPPSGKRTKHSRSRHLHQNGLNPEWALSGGQMTTGTDSPGSAGEPAAPPFQQKPTLVRGRRRSRHASSSSSSTENTAVRESVQDSLPLNTAQLHHIHERQRQIFSRRHSSTNIDQVAPHKPKVVIQPSELLKHAKLSSDSEDEVFLQSSPRQPARQPPPPQPARQPAMTDFQKWQAEQDHTRNERLKKLRETQPSDDSDGGWDGQVVPTPPSHRQTQLEQVKKERLRRMQRNILQQQKKHDSAADDSDADKENTTERAEERENGEVNGMTEVQRKEHELMMRIQRGQEELERMKQQRIQAHNQKRAEEDRKKREAAQKRLKMVSRAAEREGLQDASKADVPDHQTLKNKIPHQKATASNQNLRNTHSVKSVTPPLPQHVVHQQNTTSKKPTYQPEVNLDNEATAYYANMASTAEAQEAPPDMVSCDLCGRRFAADRLVKHRTICAKVSQKKRKVFDPAKMRAKGTENEPYQRVAPHSAKRNQTQPKKSGWRQKHEEFIESLQYARQVATVQAKGGNVAALPPPPRTQNLDYVPCPYCERRFNKDVAERHIPRCKEIKARPAPPKKRR